MFRPGFFWDELYPPTTDYPGSAIIDVAEKLPDGQTLNLQVRGENIDGDIITKHVNLPVDPAEAEGLARVLSTGLELRDEDGAQLVDMVQWGSLPRMQALISTGRSCR